MHGLLQDPDLFIVLVESHVTLQLLRQICDIPVVVDYLQVLEYSGTLSEKIMAKPDRAGMLTKRAQDRNQIMTQLLPDKLRPCIVGT